jgi:predicted RecA/RadA family phage recombinase
MDAAGISRGPRRPTFLFDRFLFLCLEIAMAFEAEFVRGTPLMVDHTPGSNVVAGQVIVIGNVVRVAHRDIAANALGALAAGGGQYRVPKATGGGTAIADGKLVYWDDTNNVVTETAGANKKFGTTNGAGADADAFILVQHIGVP